MKSTLTRSVVALATLLALGCSGAFAQTPAQPPGGAGAAPATPAVPAPATAPQSKPAPDASATPGASGGFITEQKSSQTLATSIIGMSIHNNPSAKAEDIGKVTDLILNQDHQLVGIVVGVGGFLGIGQKDVGIPWSKVEQIVPGAKTAVVKVTKAELEKAPPFTSTKEMKEKAKAAQAQGKASETQRKAAPMPHPPNTAPGTPASK